jgi:hypothetical protein
MADQDYSAYWLRHPDELQRMEQTALFGQQFDVAKVTGDWRRLLALARYARMWRMPLLECKARKLADKHMPKCEKEYLEVLMWPGRENMDDKKDGE